MKKIIFIDNYKMKFEEDYDNSLKDVIVTIYSHNPNRKIFKWKKFYSASYYYCDFENMEKMGKHALSYALKKQQDRKEYLKNRSDFWKNT